MGLRKILLGAFVAVCAIALATEDARAFWGSRGSSGSYGGSWGSSGSSGGSWGSGGSSGSWGSSGGSWGSRGSHGGFFRRHRHGSGGSSGGSWGSSGGSHGSSGGSWGSSGSHGSHGGYAYYDGGYDGGDVAVDGGYATTSAPAPKTKLTLRVPADAKVTLAGAATKQIGDVREYSTNKLPAGQTWNDYTVVVTLTRDGKTLTEERSISLTGGEEQELAIAFDGMQLARAN